MKSHVANLNSNSNTSEDEKEFSCPISRDIMTDPVTTCDGYTYEHSGIAQWLQHQSRSPNTNLILANKDLVPNFFAKKLILAFNKKQQTLPDEGDCKCPITLQFMEDPVLAYDGHTYEREAISEWLKKSNISPITRKPFISKQLITNLFARNKIKAYLNEKFFQAVQKAIESEIEACLQQGITINTRSKEGLTALHIAIQFKKIGICRLLLAKKIDINATDKAGWTALHYAVEAQSIEILKLILEYKPAIIKDVKQQTALDKVCELILSDTSNTSNMENDHSKTMQVLLAYHYQKMIDPVFSQSSPITLHHAAAIGHPAAAKILVEGGAKTDEIDAQNRTPLQIAITTPFISYEVVKFLFEKNGKKNLEEVLLQSLKTNDPELFNICRNASYYIPSLGSDLDTSVDPNISTVLRESWGAYIAKFASLEMITNLFNMNFEFWLAPAVLLRGLVVWHRFDALRFLVRYRQSLIQYNLPSLLKIIVEGGYHSVLYLLFSKKSFLAIDTIINEDGQTLLHHYVTLRNIDIVKFLISRGVDVNKTDVYGQSSLHLAVYDENEAMIKLLCEAGANVNIPLSRNGQTLLHHYVVTQNINIVKFLLSRGANINQTDDDKQSALHVAVAEEREGMVQLLCDKGVDINAVDAAGESVLSLALRKQHYSIVKLLLSKKAKVPVGLFHSFAYTDATVVALFLQHGVEVDLVDVLGRTAMFYAVGARNVSTVQELLNYNPNLNITDKYGFTPMCGVFNVPNSIDAEDLAILNLLVEKNVNLNLKYTFKSIWNQETILHLLINCLINSPEQKDNIAAAVSNCIRYHASFNVKNAKGETPFHRAIVLGADFVEIFFSGDLDFQHVDGSGNTYLHYAVRHKHVKAAKLLLENKIDIFKLNNNGDTAIDWAIKNNFVEFFHLLKEKNISYPLSNDSDGITLLHKAAAHQAVDVAQFLLQNTALEVDATSAHGWTPLHIALQTDCTPSLMRMVECFVGCGAKVTAIDEFGNNSLHIFTLFRDPKKELEITKSEREVYTELCRIIISYLEKAGVKLDAKNNQGSVPIHFAAASLSTVTFQLLINKEADMHAVDVAGNTVLHYFSMFSQVIDQYKKNKGNFLKLKDQILAMNEVHAVYSIFDQLYLGLRKVISELLKELDIDVRNNEGYTSLHACAINGSLRIADLLLKLQGNKEAADIYSNTPTCTAVLNNQTSMVAFLLENKSLSVETKVTKEPSNENNNMMMNLPLHHAVWRNTQEMVSLLLEKGEDVNAVNEQNYTALHLAVLSKNEAMAVFLLSQGAAIDMQDNRGRTPLHLAVEIKESKLIALLAAHDKKKLNIKDNAGHAPIHKATIYGHLDSLKILLKAGANVDCTDNTGGHLIHMAIFYDHREIVEFLITNYPMMVEAKDGRGWTPVCISIVNARKSIFHLLIHRVERRVIDLQGNVWTIDKAWKKNAALRAQLKVIDYTKNSVDCPTQEWWTSSDKDISKQRRTFLFGLINSLPAQPLAIKLSALVQQIFHAFREKGFEKIDGKFWDFHSYFSYRQGKRPVPVIIIRHLIEDLLQDPYYDKYKHRLLIQDLFAAFHQYQVANQSKNFAGEFAAYHLYLDLLSIEAFPYWQSPHNNQDIEFVGGIALREELKHAFFATSSPSILLGSTDDYEVMGTSPLILGRVGTELINKYNSNVKRFSEYLYKAFMTGVERLIVKKEELINNPNVWEAKNQWKLPVASAVKEHILLLIKQHIHAIFHSNKTLDEKKAVLIAILTVACETWDKWLFNNRHASRCLNSKDLQDSFYFLNYEAHHVAETPYSKIFRNYKEIFSEAYLIVSAKVGFCFGSGVFEKAQNNLFELPKTIYKIERPYNSFFIKPEDDQLLYESICGHLQGDMRLIILARSFMVCVSPSKRTEGGKYINLKWLFSTMRGGGYESKKIAKYDQYVKLQLCALLLFITNPQLDDDDFQHALTTIVPWTIAQLLNAHLYHGYDKPKIQIERVEQLIVWLISDAKASTLLRQHIEPSYLVQMWNSALTYLSKGVNEEIFNKLNYKLNLENGKVILLKEPVEHKAESQDFPEASNENNTSSMLKRF